jgi:hypothetical protein
VFASARLGLFFLKVFLKGNVSKPGMPLSSLSVWAEEDEVGFKPLILTHPDEGT